jgi:hypothetical protein
MDLFGRWTIIGFEEVSERTRHSHVLALDQKGTLHWDIPLISEDGAYLYSRGFSESPEMLVVGTDDGVISGYRLH